MSKIISTRIDEPIIQFLQEYLKIAPGKCSWRRHTTSSYLEKLIIEDLTKILGADAKGLNQRKNFIEACERFGIEYQTSLDELGW